MFSLLFALSAFGLGAVLGDHVARHEAPTPDNTPDNCATCIVGCFGVEDGDYASCNSCHYYATCSNGAIIDDRECVAGTVWDDLNKVCDYFSQCESPPVECDVVDPNAPQTLLTTATMSGTWGWTGDGGNMFDICALSDATVTITAFDTHCSARSTGSSVTVEIFAATAPNQRYSGISSVAADWTLLHQETVTCAAQYTVTELDSFNMNGNGGVVITANECRGFFVAVVGGSTVFSAAAVSEGTVHASNADIQFLTGNAKGFYDAFNSVSFAPYLWEGRIHYTVDRTPSPCGGCVDDCYQVADGDYESCSHSDAVYASCWAEGHLLDNRPCPQGLVWDDMLKRCDFTSSCP